MAALNQIACRAASRLEDHRSVIGSLSARLRRYENTSDEPIAVRRDVWKFTIGDRGGGNSVGAHRIMGDESRSG